jgi:hypothetical protein
VNVAEIGITAGLAVLGISHAWVGTRFVLPSLYELPAFQEMLPNATSVQRLLKLAWLMGSLSLCGFAALGPAVETLGVDRVQWIVLGMSLLLSATASIVGAYLGLRFRPNTQHLGTWYTVVLWAVLVVVLWAAWHAARPSSSGARPNNELQRTSEGTAAGSPLNSVFYGQGK